MKSLYANVQKRELDFKSSAAQTEGVDAEQECGHSQHEPGEVASRHMTSEGVLVYTRCACGALRVRLHRWDGGTKVLAESGPRASDQATQGHCG